MAEATDAALRDLLTTGTRFALLGLSDPGDEGDSAILAEELAWLKRQGARPRHLGTVGPTNWLRMEKRIGAGPILLHGGGSFGDTAPAAHAYREAVLWRYRGRRVVQLPLTLSFSSQRAIEQTARVIARHAAFTLLVRDQASFELAARSFACEVRLCPDLALRR